MNPLCIAAWGVQLVCDLFAPMQKPWPDGEQPLIDDSAVYFTRGGGGGGVSADARVEFEPMPGWFRGGFDDETSARSGSTSLAGVDPSAEEGPTAGRAHTLAVGHPNLRLGFWCKTHKNTAELCECPVPQKKFMTTDLHQVTKHLLISAAIGLRDYAASDACEAPVYWRTIADQLDPK